MKGTILKFEIDVLKYHLFKQRANMVLLTWAPDSIIITLYIQAKTWNHLNVNTDMFMSISARLLIFSNVIDTSSNRRVIDKAIIIIMNKE